MTMLLYSFLFSPFLFYTSSLWSSVSLCYSWDNKILTLTGFEYKEIIIETAFVLYTTLEWIAYLKFNVDDDKQRKRSFTSKLKRGNSYVMVEEELFRK